MIEADDFSREDNLYNRNMQDLNRRACLHFYNRCYVLIRNNSFRCLSIVLVKIKYKIHHLYSYIKLIISQSIDD
jgi:hypothetical protein